MGNCTKCVHKPVCELWRNEECQDASNYSESADCDYYVVYGMTPEDAATIGRFREHIFSVWSYAHMAEIAKAESEGRLVILPCKVGDTVWVAVKGVRVKEVVECVVDEISIDSYAPFAVLRRKSALGRRWHSYYIECFGKSVFLTREGAEASLAKDTNVPGKVVDDG